jgi:rhomboid protease GluP
MSRALPDPHPAVTALLERATPRAWVTPAIAALVLVGFAIETALGVPLSQPTAQQLLAAGADFGPVVALGEWWRLLTSMFLHIGPLHLALNLWAFWRVGRITERIFGNAAFLVIYFVSGIGGSLASLAIRPLVVSAGASGAIFGVYGALLAFAVLHRGVLPVDYITRLSRSVLAFVGYNVFFGLTQPNIDIAAHIGGLLAGAIAGAALGRNLEDPSAGATRRRAGAVVLAALVGLSALGVQARLAAEPRVRAARIAERARERFNAQDYAQAIDLYSQAMALGGPVRGWLASRGLAYVKSGDMESAEKDLLAANEMKETSTDLALLCGVSVMRARGEVALDEAASRCTRALALGPPPKDRAEVLANRGIVRRAQRRLDEALADANAALALDEQAVARALHASVLLDRGDRDAAEADCARLLAMGPRPYDVGLCARVAYARKDDATYRKRLESWTRGCP